MLLKQEKWRRRYREHWIIPKSGGKPRLKPYTPEENGLIIEKRKAGKLWREIAEITGRPEKYLIVRWKDRLDDRVLSKRLREHASENNLPTQGNGKFTKEDGATLKRMAASEESYYNMAVTLGRTKLASYRRLRAINRKTAHVASDLLRVRWSENDDNILRWAAEQRINGPKLWELLPSRSVSSIHSRCHELRFDMSFIPIA